MFKGILFDLDGTLVDSLSVTFDAFNSAIERLGGKPLRPAEIMSHFGPGEDKIFAKLVGPENAVEAYRIFKAYMHENITQAPLHPGVPELLEGARDAGTPISIVTGRSWSTTEMILEHHGILDRFVTVVANDHVEAPKPSPLGIRLAASRMGLDPSRTLYVGDSWVDVQAARSAGARSVAALWDRLADRDALAAHDPHHWATAPAEVWRIWEELRSSAG